MTSRRPRGEIGQQTLERTDSTLDRPAPAGSGHASSRVNNGCFATFTATATITCRERAARRIIARLADYREPFLLRDQTVRGVCRAKWKRADLLVVDHDLEVVETRLGDRDAGQIDHDMAARSHPCGCPAVPGAAESSDDRLRKYRCAVLIAAVHLDWWGRSDPGGRHEPEHHGATKTDGKLVAPKRVDSSAEDVDESVSGPSAAVARSAQSSFMRNDFIGGRRRGRQYLGFDPCGQRGAPSSREIAARPRQLQPTAPSRAPREDSLGASTTRWRDRRTAWSKIGAAALDSPSTASSRSVATPWSRIAYLAAQRVHVERLLGETGSGSDKGRR